MGSGALMSQRQYAKYIGRSVGYVNKMVQVGVIELFGPKKKIDPVHADAALEAAKDPSKDAQREANERRRQEKQNDPSIFDERVLPKESLADLSEEERISRAEALRKQREEVERLREEVAATGENVPDVDFSKLTQNGVKIIKEYYLGKLAELDYKKKSGDLIDKEEVVREASEVAMRVKGLLLSLPHKLSVRIVGIESPEIVEEMLESEIREVLEELGGAS